MTQPSEPKPAGGALVHMGVVGMLAAAAIALDVIVPPRASPFVLGAITSEPLR
jgi:hypothetical protein